MANTYYDSTLTAAKIDSALKAIDGVIVPANNGKVLIIENGKIVPKPVTDYVDLNLQAKTTTPTGSQQTISPDSGYNGLSTVTVEGVVAPNLIAGNIKKDVVIKVGTSTDDDSVMTVIGNYEGGTTPTETIIISQNGIYDVTNYASANVNVSGGTPTPSLPNSDPNDILASAYAGNFIDVNSLWGGFSILPSGTNFVSKNYGSVSFTYGGYARFDLGEANHSCAVYIVVANLDYGTNYPRIVSLQNVGANGNEPMIYARNRGYVGSTYGNELNFSENAINITAFCLNVDAVNKIVKFYMNGSYIGQLSFINAGRYVSLSATPSGSENAAQNVYYAGIVDGIESDATIIANLQHLMSIFGIVA